MFCVHVRTPIQQKGLIVTKQDKQQQLRHTEIGQGSYPFTERKHRQSYTALCHISEGKHRWLHTTRTAYIDTKAV